MSIETFETKCPNCGQVNQYKAEVEDNIIYKPYTPETKNRINIKPSGSIILYKITSEMLQEFIRRKLAKLCELADIKCPKVLLIPIYTEKKRRKDDPIHRAVASFRLVFTSEAINNNKEDGFFGSIGDNTLKKDLMVKCIWDDLVKKYSYNIRDIKSYRSSYKDLDILENRFGIDDAFLANIQEYAIPKVITLKNNKIDSRIAVSIDPELVIRDALTDPTTNKIPGQLRIDNVILQKRENNNFNGQDDQGPVLLFYVSISPNESGYNKRSVEDNFIYDYMMKTMKK